MEKNQNQKETDKANVLMATGLLTEYALFKSATQSKTLTIMLIVGLILFGGFALFLFKMAGA